MYKPVCKCGSTDVKVRQFKRSVPAGILCMILGALGVALLVRDFGRSPGAITVGTYSIFCHASSACVGCFGYLPFRESTNVASVCADGTIESEGTSTTTNVARGATTVRPKPSSPHRAGCPVTQYRCSDTC